jgi:Type ISP C-terminal specificity domain
MTAPGVDRLAIGAWPPRDPHQEFAHHRPKYTHARRAVVRSLAVRCRALVQSALERGESLSVAEAAAERRTFEEFLRQAENSPAWPELYQDFLNAYAPHQRRRHGVYYTPAGVVGAQIRLVADLLQTRFACPDAFADDRVAVVDPTTGSGAYPLAAIADTIERLGSAPPSLRRRMHLFEPLIGAACLARAHGLEVDESDALAARIQLDAPLVVCIGNPPYRRRSRGKTTIDFLAGAEGIHVKNVYNDYVLFWRWALQTVFENRSGPGIVSLVTASSYLRGPGFGGMREALRRVLDELWIVDLEGDQLAARSTDNVFPIRTPVAIALGARYGARRLSEPAVVHYARLNGQREVKLAVLNRLRQVHELGWRTAADGWRAPLIATTRSRYGSWPALTQLFPWQISGAQVKRTWPIGPTAEVLVQRWRTFLALPTGEQAAAFRETRDRKITSTPPDLLEPDTRLLPLSGLATDATCPEPARYAYRSFDRQWILPDARLGDFLRPALWRVIGPRQLFLTSLLTNVLGSGPAAVATRLVPDLDHFRGSFGARAVIPLWRDAAGTRPNVAADLLEQFGVRVSPEELMSYCYALLATHGYVARFEEELRTPGPRIPLTRDAALFSNAVALGERLISLHTFSSVPRGTARAIAPIGPAWPRTVRFERRSNILHVGAGAIAPVTRDVWAYAVSGLPIVESWLRRRILPRKRQSPLDAIGPREWTPQLTNELLEVIWILEATLALEPELDAALDAIVSGSGVSQSSR